MVCLTILSHALIAQSPSLAPAGARRLSHVVRAPWFALRWKRTDSYRGDSPSVGSQAHVPGFKLAISAQDTQRFRSELEIQGYESVRTCGFCLM